MSEGCGFHVMLGPKNAMRCSGSPEGVGSAAQESADEVPVASCPGAAAQWAAVPTKTRVPLGLVKTKLAVQPPENDWTWTPGRTLAAA
jgi:hypothetical protein